MTDRNDTNESDDTNDRTTMKDIDHTHPYDDTSAGELFLRGPVVAADGGEREAEAERNDEDPRETMKDIDHTPPDDEGANRAFERGEEHGTEPVVGEE